MQIDPQVEFIMHEGVYVYCDRSKRVNLPVPYPKDVAVRRRQKPTFEVVCVYS
jgi:hypothetical protein